MRPGNIYAVLEEDARLVSLLTWGTLLKSTANGESACLIARGSPAKSLAECGLGEQARRAIAARRITVFEMPGGTGLASGNAARRLDRLFAELAHFGTATRLLALDGAEYVFGDAGGDELAALVQRCREWSERQRSCMLLIFRQDSQGNKDPLARLLPLSGLFGGLMRIRSKYGAPAADIFHWFHDAGAVAGKTLPLQAGSDGRLVAIREEAPTAVLPVAPDENRIIAMRSVLLQQESAASGWELIDDSLDALMTHAMSAVAATVLLAFSPATPFNRMARSVYDLRRTCGPRLKIVVREINTRLRYSQETLVMRLGANLVVPAEINYARLQSLVSMVQGQVFRHDLPHSYEQALAEALPDEQQGYLPPLQFAESVSASLERSHVLNIQNALIRMPLAYGLSPLDALRYCFIKRAGDLCSADESSVYLYLYGCRESDVDLTLDRLFGLPVSELFAREERYVTERGIREAMDDFHARCAAGGLPDLSSALAGGNEARPHARTAETPGKKGVADVTYLAPAPAVKRPLSLRGASSLTDVSAKTA